MKRRKLMNRLVPGAIVLLLVIFVGYRFWQAQPGYLIKPGYLTVEQAFYHERSNVMVQVSGQIVRMLADSQDYPKSQQFILELKNGQRVEVKHDISKSERIPVALHESVTVRGEYDWSEPGGIIHWTRFDPSSERRHGWIVHKDKKYD